MEEAATVRRAALDAVGDVHTGHLVERFEDRLAGGSMAPGVLTLLSARAVDDTVATDPVVDRAAGVQLIFEGLRLTRSLAHEQPWDDGTTPEADRTVTDPPEQASADGSGKSRSAAAADLDVLVADILVARGFYLLARTEAAEAAVGVVRSFGRDQTTRRVTDDPSLDGNLEADVLELAVIAGTTAAGGSAPGTLREYVTGFASTDGDLDGAEAMVTDGIRDRLAGLVRSDPSPPGGARTSADH